MNHRLCVALGRSKKNIGVRPQCWELSVNLNELYLYVLKYVL